MLWTFNLILGLILHKIQSSWMKKGRKMIKIETLLEGRLKGRQDIVNMKKPSHEYCACGWESVGGNFPLGNFWKYF